MRKKLFILFYSHRKHLLQGRIQHVLVYMVCIGIYGRGTL